MNTSFDIPEICILSSDENNEPAPATRTAAAKDGLTDVEDLTDSGQEETEETTDRMEAMTLDNEPKRLGGHAIDNDDMDKCCTDVECYDKSDDEDDVSDYYSESDILVNNYFDNAVQEDQMVTKEMDNDDEDVLEEQKRKKAEFYAKKRERKAKRDAAKLFQTSTAPKPPSDSGAGLTDIETVGSDDDDNDNDEQNSSQSNVSATARKTYAVTDVESLENSGDESAAVDNDDDDQFDLPLPEVVCDKIIISDNSSSADHLATPSINIESFEPIMESESSAAEDNDNDDENASGFLTDVMNVSDEDANNVGSGIEFDYEYPSDVLKPFENNSVDCQSSMLDKNFDEIVDN